MENREKIIQTTIALIVEKNIENVTVREICRRANVGLGLINYYFGSKEKLIETCVEKIINGIVEKFQDIGEKTNGLSPKQKLEFLGNMTLTFLFEHAAASKISMLSDMKNPKADDNTQRTYQAYLPLIAACRPDLNEDEIRQKTFCLIASMQCVFLRNEVIYQTTGVNLKDPEQRKNFHSKMISEIIGGEK